eukprot:scaffold4902_cov115-Cylindrotheca_fusiformis.AAC.2
MAETRTTLQQGNGYSCNLSSTALFGKHQLQSDNCFSSNWKNADPFVSLVDNLFKSESLDLSSATAQVEADLFEPTPIQPQSSGAVHTRQPSLFDILSEAADAFEPNPVHIVNSNTIRNEKRCLDYTAVVPHKPDAKRRRVFPLISENENASEESAARFRPYQQHQWDAQFQELLAFQKERGHCCVPHNYEENPILSRWIKRQRYQYKLRQEGKTSTLTASRIQQLEAIGFVWDSHAAAWEERLNELKLYSLRHGHCNVPSTCTVYPQLATWVKCQRRQFKLLCAGKKSNITPERISALEDVGFQWDIQRKSLTSLQNKYQFWTK